jgi:hypothetical protein
MLRRCAERNARDDPGAECEDGEGGDSSPRQRSMARRTSVSKNSAAPLIEFFWRRNVDASFWLRGRRILAVV